MLHAVWAPACLEPPLQQALRDSACHDEKPSTAPRTWRLCRPASRNSVAAPKPLRVELRADYRRLVAEGVRSFPQLVELLDHYDSELGVIACYFLGRLGERNANEVLLAVVLDRRQPAPVRTQAIIELAMSDRKRFAGQLLEVIRGQDDPNVRATAIWAMGWIRYKKSARDLLAVVGDSQEPTVVRLESIDALVQMHPERALRALRSATRDRDPAVSTAATAAVAELDPNGESCGPRR